MFRKSVVLVEDDALIAKIVCKYLQQEGYEVTEFRCAEEAWKTLEYKQPSLLLCDINLPGETGLQLAGKYRQHNPEAVIIFLTGSSSLTEKLAAFKAGADDYITKPFVVEELLARIKAQLRKVRSNPKTDEGDQLIIGDLMIDFKTKAVYKKYKLIELFAKEKKLLFFLAENYGRVYSADCLMEAVWGYDTESELKTIVVHISNLRKKLEDDPKQPVYLKTVRGFGYKLFYDQA